ncbi:MAG: undecaprenyl-phosphate glucose phosphotransferase [Microscillaceae bacterium]|nr:undecaprenyl-phosphate glucose phosphotransferase [Microscillaceae bacterium]MDW8459917.1 undecaprenyl-phosphate glucose phosphotransferase [Cytophagales bacterium]
MAQQYHRFLRLVYLIGDLLLLNLIYILAYPIKFGNFSLFESTPYLLLLAYFNATWLVIAFLLGNYEVSRLDSYGAVARKIAQSVILHLFSVTAVFVFIKTTYFSRLHLFYTYSLFFIFGVAWRFALMYFLRSIRELGYNLKKVVIIGYNDLSRSLAQFFLKNPSLGYRVLGFFDDKVQAPEVIGKVADVETFALEKQIDEIYFALPEADKKHFKQIRKFADRNLVRLKMLPDLREFSDKSMKIEKYGNIPVINTREEPLNDLLNQAIKRTFDIVFSLFIIIFFLSWLVPLIAIAIRLNSKGPIFFLQKRSGRNGKTFTCFKFRTMKHEKDAVFVQATKNDSRVTKVGAFLRKTNLDELPQFINVLLGDMTVVGPRPHPLELDNRFKQVIDKYMVRHFVKPGITGLAQVKGYRGETKDIRSMINRVRLDVFYIENWSFFLDIKIILLTVFRMIKGDSSAF